MDKRVEYLLNSISSLFICTKKQSTIEIKLIILSKAGHVPICKEARLAP